MGGTAGRARRSVCGALLHRRAHRIALPDAVSGGHSNHSSGPPNLETGSHHRFYIWTPINEIKKDMKKKNVLHIL